MTDSNRSGSSSSRRPSYRASASVPAGGRRTAGGTGGGNDRVGRTYGAGSGRKTTPPRGKDPRKYVIVALVLSIVATLGGIGGWAYLNSLNDGLDRFDAFTGLDDRPEKVVDGSLNVLVLGSDSRNPDSTEGSRADTIMMLHIPADGAAAYIVSLPRDLWVNIPPSDDGQWGGGEEKLNAALFFGGLPLMVSTVEGYTGVRLDHVIEIDFEGLKEVVNALGGVEMDVQEGSETPGELISIHTYKGEDGPRVWQAGKQTLDGESVLDYVRQRKQFTHGDFDRMKHQQELLMAMMDKATSAGIITDPGALTEFLGSVISAVKVDQEFDLVATALQFSNLRSNDLVFLTSPNLGTDWRGDQNVVVPDDATAATMYQAVANDGMKKWVKDNPDAVKGSDAETG